MPPPQLGELSEVDPREIWKHEAHDFTPWVATNLEMLGELLGLDLELTSTEHSVGAFAADILAKDLSRDRVVVKDAIHLCSEVLLRANVGWSEVADDWVLLEALEPNIEKHGAEELATWFSARVAELAQQGVLDLVLPRAIR